MATCNLEVWIAGAWSLAGTVTLQEPSRGLTAPAAFEYDLDFLDTMLGALGAQDARAVSCRYPIGFDVPEEGAWPAFLLDIMPSGAARRHWEARLGLPNNNTSDWQVLVQGAGNPTGNLRVREAVAPAEHVPAHPGFTREDVIERAEGFVEYAREHGAPVAGSTGAGGDSPKYLLREDVAGRWHADGVLPDSRTRRCWLVKFPRTREAADRLILEAEAGYHRVAKRMGARVGEEVTWEGDCLFVPRFDRRVANGAVERLGLESLCSLAGVAEFGVPVGKERLVAGVARYSSRREDDLREIVLRDVLDVALGNTDNHARNTSVLKDHAGRIELSPLYDFAPMILDRRGIARVSRWEDKADYPDWGKVVGALGKWLDVTKTRDWLRGLAPAIEELPATMKDCGVPGVVIARCEERIRRVAGELRALGR